MYVQVDHILIYSEL